MTDILSRKAVIARTVVMASMTDNRISGKCKVFLRLAHADGSYSEHPDFTDIFYDELSAKEYVHWLMLETGTKSYLHLPFKGAKWLS